MLSGARGFESREVCPNCVFDTWNSICSSVIVRARQVDQQPMTRGAGSIPAVAIAAKSNLLGFRNRVFGCYVRDTCLIASTMPCSMRLCLIWTQIQPSNSFVSPFLRQSSEVIANYATTGLHAPSPCSQILPPLFPSPKSPVPPSGDLRGTSR